MKARIVINTVGKEIFQVALVTYLLLTLAETLREGAVSNFFNTNYLLLVVLVSGVAMVLTEPSEKFTKTIKIPVQYAIQLSRLTVRKKQKRYTHTTDGILKK